MARPKDTRLKDAAVVIKRAIEDVPELNGTNFQVEEGGLITFYRGGKKCRIKFSIETGPREGKRTKLDELLS